jgi:phosphate transport system protein
VVTELRNEFHDDLDALRRDVAQLGATAADVIQRGTTALLAADADAAVVLVADEALTRASATQLEERCSRLLTLQAPVAGELRFLLTTLWMVGELERVVGCMTDICRTAGADDTLAIAEPLWSSIEQMGVEAAFVVRIAIDAYVESDIGLAAELDDVDAQLDELSIGFVEQVLRSQQRGLCTPEQAVRLVLVGRLYERVGDHAVDIGERVRYMVSGWSSGVRGGGDVG